tara:strand:+ start:888 stop:1373 length:486 start_codon:yes stop_codon:yes gene_type:complete
LFLYDNKPSKQATNKFSGMFYTEQQIHTKWINDNKPHWKKETQELKEKINDIKLSIEEGEFYLKNEVPTPEEEVEIKLHIKSGKYAKKFYSRQLKFNIYCCNDDWENIKIYYKKIKETMEEVLEDYAENESEGKLLNVSERFKETYQILTHNIGLFKEFYE